MKKQTKGFKLEKALEKFYHRRPKNIKACVVIDERGLIIVDKAVDGFSTLSLAAMIALVSDVSIRVNDNLNLGETKLVSFSSSNGELFIKSFNVDMVELRVGTLTARIKGYSLLKRLKNRRKSMEKDLEKTCEEIKEIMGQH